MFVSKRALAAVQEEVARLSGELRAAQSSVADHEKRVGELGDAMLAARADAREVRQRAEQEGASIVGRAREEAAAVAQAAEAQVAAARAEAERLKQVQRDLSASVERSLAALRSALTDGGAPPETATREDPHAARVALDALPRFRSELPSAPAARNIPPARVERLKTEWPLAPAPPTERKVWRDEPSRAEAVRRSLLRPKPLAAGAVVLLALAGGLYWSRPTRSPRPALASAPADSARSAGEAKGGPAQGAGARPQATGSGRERRPGAVTVKLRAVRPVWVRVDVDGSGRVSRLVRAGEDLTFGADREIIIRAGDAGALLLSVDGRPSVALGPEGAVLTRRIAAPPPKPGGAASAAAAGETRRNGPILLASATRPSEVRREAGPAHALNAQPQSRQAVVPQTRLPISPPTAELSPPDGQPSSGAGVPPTAVAVLSNDENEVLHAHEAYFEALGRGDTGRMARLAGDGFTVTGAPATDGAGVPFAISLSNASVDVRGVGAVVSGTGSQRITGADGQIRHEALLFSEVWIKRGNQWQLTSVRFLSPGGSR
jgi:hypothetical protein